MKKTVRLLAVDALAALWSFVLGSFFRDTAALAYERVGLGDALRGLAVRDAMRTEVATVPAHLALSELAQEPFRRGGFHSRPVVRGEELVGLLSMGRVLALSSEARTHTSVQAVMSPLPASDVVGPGEPLVGVLARMARSGVRRLFVVEDGRLEGLLSVSAVFRHIHVRRARLYWTWVAA